MVPRSDGLTFPLVGRRRIAGTPFGAVRSARRGVGLDLAGLRPYRPGDDFRLIDRHASARISSASASDEFVVREHLTEEGVRVVVLADGSATMSLYPEGTPWLSKPAAVAAVTAAIGESAARARCRLELMPAPGSLDDLLTGLIGRARPPRAGSFVFLVSDFLRAPGERALAAALARRWDLVPVVIQDPTWEQSFPPVAGAVVPFADPASGRIVHARLTRVEAAERRRAHEARRDSLLRRFDALGLDYVLVSTSDAVTVVHRFVEWATARQTGSRLR